MDRNEVLSYIGKYASSYSKEQITKRLLESGASYDDIEDGFHKYYNNEHFQNSNLEEKDLKNNNLNETKKRGKNYSLIITVIAIIIFGIVLLFPYQVGSIFLNDSIQSSYYFEIDSKSSFNDNQINLFIRPVTNMDLEISQNDPKNFIFVENNMCRLEEIKSESVNVLNEEFIYLEKNNLYEFQYICERNFSNENVLYGQISFNLYENSIEDYIFIQKGIIQITNKMWD